MRSLACAASGYVADHDYGHIKTVLTQDVPVEHLVAHVHRRPVQFRARQQNGVAYERLQRQVTESLSD